MESKLAKLKIEVQELSEKQEASVTTAQLNGQLENVINRLAQAEAQVQRNSEREQRNSERMSLPASKMSSNSAIPQFGAHDDKWWWDVDVDLALGGCTQSSTAPLDSSTERQFSAVCAALASTRADNADIQLERAQKALLELQVEVYPVQSPEELTNIPSEDQQAMQDRFDALHYAFYKHTCRFPRNVPGDAALAHHIETASVDISASLSGAYCSNPKETRVYNFGPGLARETYNTFLKDADSVVEFGSGDGRYSISWLARSEVSRATGRKGPIVIPFEGAVGVEQLTSGLVHHADLTIPHMISPSMPLFDWVVSFEVAEHVPRQFEKILVENFVRHARKGVVISWSTSSSHWHVNARENNYVKGLFKKYGFSPLDQDISKIRSDTSLQQACTQTGECSPKKLHWLRGTALAFKRDVPLTLPDDVERKNTQWLNALGKNDLSGEKMEYICTAKWDGKQNFVEYLKNQPWARGNLKWPCNFVLNPKGQTSVVETLRVAKWEGLAMKLDTQGSNMYNISN